MTKDYQRFSYRQWKRKKMTANFTMDKKERMDS